MSSEGLFATNNVWEALYMCYHNLNVGRDDMLYTNTQMDQEHIFTYQWQVYFVEINGDNTMNMDY